MVPASTKTEMIDSYFVLLAYVSERRLVRTSKLATLRGLRIGFDVLHWLRRLMNAHKEPFHLAIGGAPLLLRRIIEDDLKDFRYFVIRL